MDWKCTNCSKNWLHNDPPQKLKKKIFPPQELLHLNFFYKYWFSDWAADRMACHLVWIFFIFLPIVTLLGWMDGWLGAVIIIMDTLNLENIQQLQQGLKNPDTKNIWDIYYYSYISIPTNRLKYFVPTKSWKKHNFSNFLL